MRELIKSCSFSLGLFRVGYESRRRLLLDTSVTTVEVDKSFDARQSDEVGSFIPLSREGPRDVDCSVVLWDPDYCLTGPLQARPILEVV